MASTPPAPVLEALLRDLGMRRGSGADPSEPQRCTTGLADVDRMLQGGLPRGRLSEVTGVGCGGRTSLALNTLAHATGRGEFAAWVDAADAFDPASATAAGVDLERVLWVRAPGRHEALRSVERLLGTRGFALVLLDLDTAATAVSPHTWPRLRKAASATHAAVVVLAAERLCGSYADVVLETADPRPCFEGRPTLLLGFEGEVRVVRNRLGPLASGVRVQWHASGSTPWQASPVQWPARQPEHHPEPATTAATLRRRRAPDAA